MIRAQYAVVAEFQRAGQGGTFDLLGLFDRIYTPEVPAQHRSLVFVALLVTDDEGDLGKKPMRFYCVLPSGKLLAEQRGQLDIRPGGGTWFASARVSFELQGMPVPEYGKYRFVLEVNGVEVASHVISVSKPPPAK